VLLADLGERFRGLPAASGLATRCWISPSTRPNGCTPLWSVPISWHSAEDRHAAPRAADRAGLDLPVMLKPLPDPV
jgi:hypothetical protein